MPGKWNPKIYLFSSLKNCLDNEPDKLGDLVIDSDDNKLKYRNNAETKEVVNLDESQELSNKTQNNTNTLNYDNSTIGTIDPLQKDMTNVDNEADALDAIIFA